MCGIAGIVERDSERPVSDDRLADMVRALTHRGPDDAGQIALRGAGLGMRRLSVIDVQGGQQPFASEDGTVHLVGNGEIYNHEVLRTQLIARGHKFSSGSDVEVALHAYEEWGESFVERLHGMFALALWDRRSRTLVATRDRAGEKPLYYSQTPRGMRFASEIKALLVCPDISREVDLEALDQFLTYEYTITPLTIFSAVRRLPAAHYMVYRNGELTVTRYWDASAVARKSWTDEDAASALRHALHGAVSRQTMSDVPLGAFLSGGLDSSTIVAMMAEVARRERTRVNTFSMGFADGSYNELPYARRVAERFQTRHLEGTVEPNIAELFHRLVVHLDEPFADVSVFPTFLVSEIARSQVTVALSGDGGDELFGGYDAYDADRLARRVSAVVPRAGTSALAGLTSLFPPSEKKKGLVNKLKRFTAGLAATPPEIEHYRWMTYLSPAAKQRPLHAGASFGSGRGGCVPPRARSAARIRHGRPAEPPTLRGPQHLPCRRHSREGGPHEHGLIAGDKGAVPRCRGHGACLLHAGMSQDPSRRTQVRPETRHDGHPASVDPPPIERGLQHPDEELAQAGSGAVDARPPVAGACFATRLDRTSCGYGVDRCTHGRTREPRSRAV